MHTDVRTRVVLAAAALAMAGALHAAPAGSVLERLLKSAAVTVVGQVVDVRAVRTTNESGDEIIVTRAMVRVSETLRGPRIAWLPLELEGGTLNGTTLKVSDVPQLREGDRAVFLADLSGERYVLHGRGAGVLPLTASDRIEGLPLSLDDVRRLAREVR